VHFHGWDASIHDFLREMAEPYRRMFQYAAGVIGVSRAMCRKLVELGAPAERVHWVPCGIDCQAFAGGNPAAVGPQFLAVGRFTEKKAPDLTLRAFAATLQACPEARLQMIGFGPLLEPAQALARELGITNAVTFAGACPPAVVQEQMRQARCFVQHSIVAPNGDSEGTPVSILEAGASGLPVVSTRHAGIPDVVSEGETGFLVDERDVAGMAEKMIVLAKDPTLAASLGAAARRRIAGAFSSEQSIGKLWSVLQGCAK
jgi:colanic acid/amylovoran biosynthesis glycosyltransferase